MAEGKKSFSETRIYPVFFMIVVAVCFGLILSTFYHTTKERVEFQSEMRLKTAILDLFDIDYDEDSFDAIYESVIEEDERNGIFYYKAHSDDEFLGFCFPVLGNGLWGSISALMAIDADLNELIGLHIVEQNETPGLGGRITEDEFLNQFSGKKATIEGELVVFNLIGENESADETEINQITGATSSSQAVLDMLHRSLRDILEVFSHE